MSSLLGALVSALALSPLLGVSQLVQLALGESSNSCPAYHPVIFDISKLHPTMRVSLHEGVAPISSSNGTKPLVILNNTQKHFQQLLILNHTKHYHTFFLTAPQNKPFVFHVSCRTEDSQGRRLEGGTKLTAAWHATSGLDEGTTLWPEGKNRENDYWRNIKMDHYEWTRKAG